MRYLLSNSRRPADRKASYRQGEQRGVQSMIDFVLGFAFVAMIISPAFVATCLRHFTRIDFEPAQATASARRKDVPVARELRKRG